MVIFVKLSEVRKIIQALPPADTSVPNAHTLELLEHLGMEPGSFYQELEMESAYVDTHQDISHSNAHLQFHSHAFYEMLCCRNSCGAEYLVGTERYKLQKGDIIMVPPGISHRPLLPDLLEEPYIRDVLWISKEFLMGLNDTTSDLFTDRFSKPFLFRTAGTNWEFICDLFRRGVREAEAARFAWDTLVIANTTNIIVQLVRAGLDQHAKPITAEKPDLLDQVIAYVEKHLSEKITLADISHQFYISESTVTQNFRKKMGVSFYRYVTQRRLIASKQLISTGIPLETVAEKVGFTDYSSFFRAFKQEYGISPRQYRKMQNI